MKIVVFTLGCKVNSYESEVLISGLRQCGHEVSDQIGYADLYILNTCAVTEMAEKKSRQAVTRLTKFNPNARVIVCGCASEKSPQDFLSKKGVSLVTGAKNKEKILEILEKEGLYIQKEDIYPPCNIIPQSSKTRAHVKIQDGCNNFCSYCIIPYLRGRSRSRNIQEVIAEIEKIDSLETVITGIDISDYNYQGFTLADLIQRCQNFDKRIRLGSLHLSVIDQKLLNALKELKRFSPHFHLSLQAGSDKVLESMNRKYTAEEFLQKVKLIREYFPQCAITTDVIVGYATETELDFERSLEVCAQAEFADIHCFPYSPREGTVGASLKDLPSSVKKARMDKILQLKKQLIYNFYIKNQNEVLDFIPEEYDGEYTIGTTGNYIRCKVKGKIEKEIKIKLIKFAEICLAQGV